MYKDKLIGVVVPAHNEEDLIGKVLSTMPTYVELRPEKVSNYRV